MPVHPRFGLVLAIVLPMSLLCATGLWAVFQVPLGWALFLTNGAPLLGLVLLGLALPFLGESSRILEVRQDPDFGRISLFHDGAWEGAVDLEPLSRPIDIEIEGTRGPTLAQRLAFQRACVQFPTLLEEIASETAAHRPEARDVETFRRAVRFLTLRLPESESAPDWAVTFVLELDPSDEAGYRVEVKDGAIVGFGVAV